MYTDRIHQQLHSFSILLHFHRVRGSLLNALLHFTCALYKSSVISHLPHYLGIKERKKPLPPKISDC